MGDELLLSRRSPSIGSGSPIKHAFTFTPSFSIFIDCEDDAELERLYTGLSEGGAVLMPPSHTIE